ncbi:MAG: GTPase [Candidatus Bathyarchaeia archaeon]
MVTNLPVKAKLKWAEVEAARSPNERAALMREFLSLCPKHKGTSKLIAHVKHQVAVLEREMEAKRQQRRGRSSRFFLEKQGAAQVAILGPTCVGRSSLLAAVTNAKPEVGGHPYKTRQPVPGMLQYEDVQLQLVEAPPLVEGSAEGKADGPQVLGLARNADGLLLMVDLADDPVARFKTVVEELEKAHILVEKPSGRVEIVRKGSGVGVHLVGTGILVDATAEDVRRLLAEYRIRTALVRLWGKVSLDDVEAAIFAEAVYRPTVVVGNKADLPRAPEGLKALRERLDDRLPLLAVSCLTGDGLEKLGEALFQTLGIVRVYTREPGENEPDPRPIIVKQGATVAEVARQVHSDFAERFRYAKLTGPNAKHQGERVGAAYAVRDRDVLELHT